jgi:hypothetical protein
VKTELRHDQAGDPVPSIAKLEQLQAIDEGLDPLFLNGENDRNKLDNPLKSPFRMS